MKAFLDTSVLVPVFYGVHIHHAASLALFTSFGKGDACCAAHSLVEVYSVMTRMPGKHRITGDQGMLFDTTDVIDTYSYRALRQLGNFSMSSAVVLFQSVLGVGMILASNAVVRRIDPDSAMF